MITFRLTEQEYEDVNRTCIAQGAHSVSEFARETICQRVRKPRRAPEHKLDARLRELSGAIGQLRAECTLLHQLLAAVLPGESRGTGAGS